MIKTIKVKKQLRLDELIKYVWDNDVQNERFRSKESDMLVLVEHGRVFTEWTIDKCETFTVEVEEEITEDTKIPKTAIITENETINSSWNNSIKGLKSYYPGAVQIHAIINGKLELIWERESDEI